MIKDQTSKLTEDLGRTWAGLGVGTMAFNAGAKGALNNRRGRAQDVFGMKALPVDRLAFAVALLATAIMVSTEWRSAGGSTGAGQAPSNANSKAKQEKFGSSLKRLKWDTANRAAVET